MRRWPIFGCLLLLAGCAAPAAPSADGRLVITAQAGGTHDRTTAVGDAWYQTLGSRLLVVDPRSGEVLRSVELAPAGASGPATDMAVVGGQLFVALDRTGIVAVSIAEPAAPRVEQRVGGAELGVQPTTISVIDDELYVSGLGGVVRWSDRRRWLPAMDCGTVADSGVGLVAASGRRVHRLEDATFVGSASALFPLPDGLGPAGGFVFVRFGRDAAAVGLMTARLRELNIRLATVEVEATVRRVRVHDDRLWVVGDEAILAYPVSGDRLLEPVRYAIAGARDLQFVEGRRAAVVGSFGRASVRFDRDGGVETLHEHREPAGLIRARCDGRRVQAGGPHGWWEYDPAGRAVPLATPPAADMPAPPPAAVTIAGRATVAGDRASVRLPGGAVHEEPGIACLVAVDGRFWLGHERGITVLDPGGVVVRRLRLAGPVRHIFPLVAGGAAWVSEDGGFGTVHRTGSE